MSHERELAADVAEILAALGDADDCDANDTSPKFETVVEQLRAAHTRNSEFKALIRVETRLTARWLAKSLAVVEEKKNFPVKPCLVLGRGSREWDAGFTDAEVRSSVAAFRSGSSNVLRSTSVVQEGFDVKSCDLVVCFNAECASSGIDIVQLTGRGRKEVARFVVLAGGAKDRIQFRGALRQADNMRRVVAAEAAARSAVRE